MSAAAAAARGRRLAESMMSSTCTVREPGGERVMDPETGVVISTPGAVVYSGKCRIKPGGTTSQTTEAGGAEMFTFDFAVSLPFSVTAVRERMLLTMDASPDPAAVGLELEVQQMARGEHITARRLLCNEVA